MNSSEIIRESLGQLPEGILEKMEKAARRGGAIMLSAENADKDVHAKPGTANYVTKYDSLVQQAMRKELSWIFPQAGFLGEEDGADVVGNADWEWIVDPIDGTTNFIHRYHHSAVSIALAYHRESIAGVVYDPYTDEVYKAVRGGGAFLNDRPVHVSDLPLASGLCGFGTSPYHRHLADRTFETAKQLFLHAADIRRSGSAAKDLCDIAAGRLDLDFEIILQPWDFAAAKVIIEEAGGCMGHLDGTELDLYAPNEILAGNPKCFEEFVRLGIGAGNGKES